MTKAKEPTKPLMISAYDKYFLEGAVDFENRCIDFDGDVDECAMGYIKRAVKIMIKRDPKADITLNIASPGGVCYDGLGLFDVLRRAPCLIRTHCEGYAMSMGLIIFMAGDVRTCGEHATFMAHSVSGGSIGKMASMEVDMNEVKRLNDMLVKILGSTTKKSAKWWDTTIKHDDRYYTAKDAKKLGILS